MNIWLFVLIYSFMIVVIAAMPIYNNLPPWVPIVLALIVPAIERGVKRYRLLLTLIFAKTRLIALFTCLLALVGTGLMVSNGLPNHVMDAVQFTLQGAVIGVVIRQLILSVILNGLFGRSTSIQSLLLLLGFAIVIWLYPTNQYTVPFRGFYVLGVSIGLIVHILWRYALLRRYKRSRYARGVMEMLNGDKRKLTTDEENAFKLFINRRKKSKFKRLLRSLETQGKLTPRLKILKAHALRVSGRYSDALVMINHEIAAHDNTDFKSLFLLQKALALSEIYDEDSEMYEALEESKRLKDNNFLVNAILALRRAEELTLDEIESNDGSLEPLRLFRQAMLENTSEASFEVLSDLFGDSIPMRWGFVHDVYGYTLLKAGDFSFSKDLFINCIEKEPSFASAYLHLGEWNVAWAKMSGSDAKKYIKLARDCFKLAKKLQRNQDSRISKQADYLIKTSAM